jgi:hypothetical protein
VLVVSVLGANVALAEPEQGFPNDSRYSWNNVTIVAGGFITGIVPNSAFKDVMYVRTDIGGAYRYDPFSHKWTPLNDIFSSTDWNLMGTESIAVDPVQPWRVYLAQGTYTQSWAGKGAILASDNFGLTFRRSDLPIKLGSNEAGRYSGERLGVDPQHPNVLYLGSRNNGLWKSSDFGRNWNQVTTFPITSATNGASISAPMVAASSTEIPLPETDCCDRRAGARRSGASIVRDSALRFAVTRRSPTEIACKPDPFRG